MTATEFPLYSNLKFGPVPGMRLTTTKLTFQVASLTCKICDESFHSEAKRDDHEDTAHGEKVDANACAEFATNQFRPSSATSAKKRSECGPRGTCTRRFVLRKG